MFRKVNRFPFTIIDGKKILQCHSKGDDRYSPFFCKVKVLGELDHIENHYQTSKVFENDIIPRDWRHCKELEKQYKQIGWIICGIDFDLKLNENNIYELDDYGIQWYIALWYKYLRLHPELIEYAKQFDDYEDPYKGKFPFCQADVIRCVCKEGLESLKSKCQELLLILKDPYE